MIRYLTNETMTTCLDYMCLDIYVLDNNCVTVIICLILHASKYIVLDWLYFHQSYKVLIKCSNKAKT